MVNCLIIIVGLCCETFFSGIEPIDAFNVITGSLRQQSLAAQQPVQQGLRRKEEDQSTPVVVLSCVEALITVRCSLPNEHSIMGLSNQMMALAFPHL